MFTQEKFNKKMNKLVKELDKLDKDKAKEIIKQFNKQSKDIKIGSSVDVIFNEIKDGIGKWAEEKLPECKEKVKESAEIAKSKVIETKDTLKDLYNRRDEIMDKIRDLELRIELDDIKRKPGETWTDEDVNGFLRTYIRARNEKGFYDPKIKEKVSRQYSVNVNSLTNTANTFINSIIKENKYPYVFTVDKTKSPLTRKEILGFKFRDVKYCKNLDSNLEYKKLSNEDKELLKQEIKERNKRSNEQN